MAPMPSQAKAQRSHSLWTQHVSSLRLSRGRPGLLFFVALSSSSSSGRAVAERWLLLLRAFRG